MTDGADDPTRTASEADTSAQADAVIPTEAAASAEGDSDEFLKSLVGAMRNVAETSRDTSIAELRSAIDARIEALSADAAQAETDIRRQADTELEAVGDWERTEIERVKTEAEGKRQARRTKLEEDLAEHRASSERTVEATRSRLAQHENELAAFFAQLGEISDPAAFVAAAKRMPRAPELEGAATTAATDMEPSTPTTSEAEPATPTDDPRLTALAAVEPAEAAEAAADTVEADASDVAAGNGVGPTADAQLAERLAQLDERLGTADEPTSAPATPAPAPASAGGETSTAIIVKGLGSFGAITSFKQSLERVEGVRGVTLSLGPTGEFVYRASHAGEFDLKAAITSIEGPTATIEETDGTLVVTLSRGR